MHGTKKTSTDKRTKPMRDCRQSSDFFKGWERLQRSGKHDMHRLKEAMLLLVANDGSLPSEWKDHQLEGSMKDYRECHVKGDLLLVYQLEKVSHRELVVFIRAGTHSELFRQH